MRTKSRLGQVRYHGSLSYGRIEVELTSDRNCSVTNSKGRKKGLVCVPLNEFGVLAGESEKIPENVRGMGSGEKKGAKLKFYIDVRLTNVAATKHQHVLGAAKS